MDILPVDLCSFAVFTALQCTVIPRTEVFLGESGMPEDFEVSGDICDAVSLAAVAIAGAPLCITASKVIFFLLFTSFLLLVFEIGDDILLLDCTGDEASCCSCTLTAAIAPDGKLCGMWKHGEGTLSPSEMVQALKVFT